MAKNHPKKLVIGHKEHLFIFSFFIFTLTLGVALGPWPIRISDTSSYVLGQMHSQSWGGGDSDIVDNNATDFLR